MASARTARSDDRKDNSERRTKKVYSWTQPVCVECWNGLKLKTGRHSEQLTAQHHFCAYCRSDIPEGSSTYAMRINPGAVPYPTIEKGEE